MVDLKAQYKGLIDQLQSTGVVTAHPDEGIDQHLAGFITTTDSRDSESSILGLTKTEVVSYLKDKSGSQYTKAVSVLSDLVTISHDQSILPFVHPLLSGFAESYIKNLSDQENAMPDGEVYVASQATAPTGDGSEYIVLDLIDHSQEEVAPVDEASAAPIADASGDEDTDVIIDGAPEDSGAIISASIADDPMESSHIVEVPVYDFSVSSQLSSQLQTPMAEALQSDDQDPQLPRFHLDTTENKLLVRTAADQRDGKLAITKTDMSLPAGCSAKVHYGRLLEITQEMPDHSSRTIILSGVPDYMTVVASGGDFSGKGLPVTGQSLNAIVALMGPSDALTLAEAEG